MQTRQHLALAKAHPSLGPQEANRRGRVGQFFQAHGPTPALGKLNLIDAYAATKRLAALLTTCHDLISISPSIVASVLYTFEDLRRQAAF